ncbi:MAG: hypothetical protein C4531_14400 [Desulfurivibrio sp.]|nr:MAG: hypothetical protein C4531_14400 [Desulfurivibrio sp.]
MTHRNFFCRQAPVQGGLGRNDGESGPPVLYGVQGKQRVGYNKKAPACRGAAGRGCFSFFSWG